MKLTKIYSLILLFLVAGVSHAQDGETEARKPGHTNENKFKQLYTEFSSPNQYRSASGAPGPMYYQQQADYKMDIRLDDKESVLYGNETITYTNNSPDVLEYLWVQLDQNVRAKDSKSPLIEGSGAAPAQQASKFVNSYMGAGFDGGFKIDHVKDTKGNDLSYTINRTMMRIDIPAVMQPGDKYSFNIKWWYNVVNHTIDRARSG
jgi:hypothetical protein